MDTLLVDLFAVQFPQVNVGLFDGRVRDVHRIADLLDGTKKSNTPKQSLLVPINATHSGTRVNERVYPGVYVRDSVGSWTKPYPKPFTKGHPVRPGPFGGGGNTEPDVLGRVSSAEYHMLVSEDALKHDFKNPGIRDRGSGFIRVVTNVTDGEAIEQISDGRMLTVSSGQRTDRLYCSICAQDWLKDGMCDHRPGRTYTVETKGQDGRKKGEQRVRAYHITGRLKYDHLASVMSPAQPHAQIDAASILMGDSQWTEYYDGQPLESTVDFVMLSDGESEPVILANSPEILEKMKSGGAPQNKDSGPPRATCVAFDQLPLADDEGNKSMDKDPKEGEPRQFSDQELAKRHMIASLIDAGIELDLEDSDETLEDLQELADELETDSYELTKDQMALLFNGEDKIPEDFLKDAKLSAAARKKLPDSAFCGPDRSFPVPDCAHAVAARRLIGRADLSSEKKKRVLSCVSRKSKRMKCDSGDDSKDELVEVTPGQHLGAVKDSDKKVKTDPPKSTQKDLDDLSDSELKAECRALRAQLKAKKADVNSLIRENVELTEELADHYAGLILDARRRLSQPGTPEPADEEGTEAFLDGMRSKSLEYLRDAVSDVQEQLAHIGGNSTSEGDETNSGIVHKQERPGPQHRKPAAKGSKKTKKDNSWATDSLSRTPHQR